MAANDPPLPAPAQQEQSSSSTETPRSLEMPIDTTEKPPSTDSVMLASSDAPIFAHAAPSTEHPPAEEPTSQKVIAQEPTIENSIIEPSTIEEGTDKLKPPVAHPHAEDRELPMEEVTQESFYLRDLKAPQKKALIELKAKIRESIMDNSFLAPPKPLKSTKKVDAEEEQEDKAQEGEKTENTTEEGGQAAIAAPLDITAKVPSTTNITAEVPSTTTDTTEKVPSTTIDTEVPLVTNAETATTTTSPILEITRDVTLESTPEEQEVFDNHVVPPSVDEGLPSLEDLALWGIPLLHSKGDERTDVLLLKFLRARDFKVEKALNMLQDTLLWRKEFRTDGLIEEETPADFHGTFIHGVDRQGHPVCYIGELSSKKSVDDEAQLKRRIQVLEKGIQTLDFSPNGVHAMAQVIDFGGHSPAFLGRGIRSKILDVLQNNYPELVCKQIFINVPWYFPALLSLFNPRTRSKAVLAKPGRVCETLFKNISPDQVPVQYGGLSRLNDTEFAGVEAPVTQVIVKAGDKHLIELPAPNAGRLIWDLSVVGWDVLYEEEFVPDEGYIKIIRKAARIPVNEQPLRNTFLADALGKMVITIDNTASRRRRIVVYRYAINAS